MKNIFGGRNRKNRRQYENDDSEWINLDEDNRDYVDSEEYEEAYDSDGNWYADNDLDADNEIDEEEVYYADDETDEDEAYYADDETDEDEAYYADDETDEDEAYYADDETDEDEAYYADDETDEDEAYYADDETDEDEAYYADDETDEDEEYYADDEIDEDEAYYADDEDGIYEDIDDEDGIYEDIDVVGRRRTNLFLRMLDSISNMSMTDHVLAVTGMGVLIVAVFAGIMYMNAKGKEKTLETFAEVGTQAAGINVIGEEGLIAVADAQLARSLAAEMEMQDEEEEEEETGVITVRMNLSSIQSDLKIKFNSQKTGKLIPNVSFEVTVTGPDGKEYTLEDEDGDGIIYQTGISAGTYEVAMVRNDAVTDFMIDTKSQSITVKDTIEYKAVDVADEIKRESQIDVAAEDTKVNDTTVESVNVDTVEWVESTRTPISEGKEEYYEAVSKSSIHDPDDTARADFNESNLVASDVRVPEFLLLVQGPDTHKETVSVFEEATDNGEGENESETEPPKEPEPSPSKEPEPSPSKEPEPNPSKEPDPSPSKEPEPSPSKTPEPSPSKAPEPSPSKAPSPSPSKSPEPSPSAGVSPSPSATVSPSPSIKPSPTPTPKPTQKPDDDARHDTKSRLKDRSGTQIYIKNSSGDYVEAVYADYYKTSEFYVRRTRTEVSEYRYTGWQEIDGKTYFFDKNGNKITGEQVIQGAHYNFGSDGALHRESGNMGIDVSKWNGNIDWNAVRNAGVSYAIIRVGYRGSTTGALIDDPTFKANIQGATAAGIKVGVYFFTQATNEAEAVSEASMVLERIKGYNLSYPIFLDVEATAGNNGRADGISRDARTRVCQAFCQTIQNAGYRAGIYANKTWLTSHISTGSLTQYKIWLAQYAAAPSYTATRYDMWQYSSKGAISGINGYVDLNINYSAY